MSALFYASYLSLWLLMLIQGVLLLLVYRHFGVMALSTVEGIQRDGLPIGEKAPALSGVTATGEAVTWRPQSGCAEFLLFAAPECEPCAKILPFVSQLGTSSSPSLVHVTTVVAGPQENAVRVSAKFFLPSPCIAEDGSGAFDNYRVRVTPFAFVIGEEGRILAKGLCSDGARLASILHAGGQSEAAAVVETTLRSRREGFLLESGSGVGEAPAWR